MLGKTVLSAAFLLACVLAGAAPVYRSFEYTARNGLSGNSIRCMYQDSDGFIWFGSLEGLTRYDGYDFRVIEPSEQDAKYWTDRYVKRILEDDNHFLWLVTDSDKVACYDKRHECFVDWSGCGQWLGNYDAVTLGGNGDVWVWSESGGCRRVFFSGGVLESEEFSVSAGNLPSDRVNEVLASDTDGVWICTSGGLLKVEGGVRQYYAGGKECEYVIRTPSGNLLVCGDGAVLRLSSDADVRPFCRLETGEGGTFSMKDFWMDGDTLFLLFDSGIRAVNLSDACEVPVPDSPALVNKCMRDESGDLWWSANMGVISYVDVGSGRLHRLELISPGRLDEIGIERFSVTSAPDGKKWISLFGGGLFSYEPESGELVHFSYHIGESSAISSDYLLCVMADQDGNIWTGSEYQGVNMLIPSRAGAKYYYPADSTLVDRSNTIRMIRRVEGFGVFVAARRGQLYLYDEELRSGALYMDSAPVTDVLLDHKDRLWLATRGEGLVVQGRWSKASAADPDALSDDNVYDLHADREGRVWVATLGGGINLAEESDGKLKFRHFFAESSGKRNARCIEEDSEGRLWVGTNGGIVVFDPDSLVADDEAWTEFSFEKGTLPGNEIRSIYADSSGTVWCSVSGVGLAGCRMEAELKNCRFRVIKSSNGLGNNVVQSMVEDRSGRLWMGTEYGLSCLDPKTGHIENHVFSRIAPGNVYMENSADVLADGRLAFGTNHGFAVIDPEEISGRSVVPHVRFTSCHVDGRLMRPGEDNPSITYTDRLKLKYNRSSLRLHFSAMTPSDAGDLLYSWKLSPGDEDYGDLQSSNSVQLPRLAPGRYTFSVRALNPQGVWGPESSLDILISPPFWRSWIAVLMYIFMAAAALIAAYRFVDLKKKARLEREMTDYKLAFFTNVSHEFRTPLTLIRNAEEKLSSLHAEDSAAASSLRILKNNVNRMLRLVNQLLEFRKVQEGVFRVKTEDVMPVESLRDAICDFRDVSESKSMKISLEVRKNPGKVRIAAKVLDMAFYNILSNAVKYSPSGSDVIVCVGIDGGRVFVEVADSGGGIPEEFRDRLFDRFAGNPTSGDSMGLGLHISREMLAAAGGELSYAPKEGGSVFRISLPVMSEGTPGPDRECLDAFVEEVAGNAAKNPVGAPSSGKDGKSLLIIEDNTEIRNFLVAELAGEYRVSSAADGAEGLEAVRGISPDIVLCDILMPGMNGYDVVSAMKSDFATSHIPVILMTALCSEDDEIKGRECGADSYVRKPFSLKLLRSHIGQILASRESLRRRYAGMSTPSSADIGVETGSLSARDGEFLDRFKSMVEAGLQDAAFSTEDLPARLGVSRTVFYRKVRSLLSCTPNEFLRECRMNRAAELLSASDLNISEVSYSVGIDDPLYFSRCFKKHFGLSPKEYRSRK